MKCISNNKGELRLSYSWQAGEIRFFYLYLTKSKLKYNINITEDKALKITKEKLSEIYHSMSNKEACKKLGVTEPTLLRMIDKAGIEKKGSGRTDKIRIV